MDQSYGVFRVNPHSLEIPGNYSMEIYSPSLIRRVHPIHLTPRRSEEDNDVIFDLVEEPVVDQGNLISYDSQFELYALAIEPNVSAPQTVAIGSFMRNGDNVVRILSRTESDTLRPIVSLPHGLPATKLMFKPASCTSSVTPSPITDPPRLIASASNAIRIWRITNDPGLYRVAKLAAKSDASPVTSFDWQGSKIASASLDSTVSLWEIGKERLERQTVVHERGVFDVALNGPLVASAGEDSLVGSVKRFDVRSPEHPETILSGSCAFLRVAWSETSGLLAAISSGAGYVSVIDLRRPSEPVLCADLLGSAGNAISWNGDTLAVGCTSGRVLLFEKNDRPVASWSAGGSVVNMQLNSKSLAVVTGNRKFQMTC